MKINKLLLYFSTLVVLSSSVTAYGIDFNTLLHPFALIDTLSFYMLYRQFIDAVIYLMLFLSLGQIAFLKVFKDNKKEAKMVAIAIGLALTVSMMILESNTGFYLGQLAPIALIIFLIVLAMLLYTLLLGLFEGENHKTISAVITYLIVYGLMVVPFGVLYKWIEQNIPLLSALLELFAFASFVYLIIKTAQMFSNKDKKTSVDTNSQNAGNNNPGANQSPPDTTKPPETPQPEQEPKKTDGESEKLDKILILIRDIKEKISKNMKDALANINEYREAIAAVAQKNPTYQKYLRPVVNVSNLDDLEKNANAVIDAIKNHQHDIPQDVGAICVAIKNRILEYRLYQHLHVIFYKPESEYASMLQKYIQESPKVENDRKKLTKTAQTGFIEIGSKIKTAIQLHVG